MAAKAGLPRPDDVQAYAYVRVSTKQQEEKGSLQRAEDEMKDWLRANGYTHAKLYLEAKSGGEDDRPKWLELQRDVALTVAAGGKRPLIVVREVSRWARDEFDWFWSMKPLRDMGVQLYAISNNILTSTRDNPRPSDDLLFGVLAGVSQQAKEEGRERTRAGLSRKAKTEGKTGGSIPLLAMPVDLGNGPPRGTGYRQMWAMSKRDVNPQGLGISNAEQGRNFPDPILDKPRLPSTIKGLLKKMATYEAAGVLEGWFRTMDVLTDLVAVIGQAVPKGKIRGAPVSYRKRKTASRLMNIMRGYSGFIQDPITYTDFRPTKADLLAEAEVSEEELEAAHN
jgi:DNA invertase Pin-like site-specific DNA recombinase